MSRSIRLALAASLILSSRLFAAVFVVPDDQELVGKSAGIVVGVVNDSAVRTRDDGYVETVYDVRVQRALKGELQSGSVVQVASPGGVTDERSTVVVGSAHFRKGDRVVLFLTRDHGTWTPTDMTLGKFRFVTSTGGQSLLVRDEEDIVGFDRDMKTHVEKIRREAEFLRFIEDTVRGRKAEANYFVAPSETVALPPEETAGITANATSYSAASYAIQFNGGQYAGRWEESSMSASIANPFYKNASQSASGLADGGVGMLTSALGAWINDCPSYVNIPYGGTSSALKNPDDGINVVVWNDPGAHIAGSWTGSGVIATAFMSGGGTHSFDGLTNGWVSLSDSDVVVQNGLTGTESFVATALTHEIGHAIGLRHSNTHFDGTACQATDDCTSSAVMNSSVGVLYNYSLQAWDKAAIGKLYPASCSGTTPPPAPTGLTATAGSSSVTVSWTAATGASSYKVFRRSAPGSYTQIAAGVAGTSFTDGGRTANTSYQYVVRATNAGGDSGDSNADFATTTTFTDAMVSGVQVRTVHFTELRTAVNALRTLAGLTAFSFASPAPGAGVGVTKTHVDGLRTALNQARAQLGAASLSFGETISAPVTTIKASHLAELRSGVR